MKITFSIEYKLQPKRFVTLTSEPVHLKEANFFLTDLKKQKNITNIVMEDEYGSSWTEKELTNYLKKLQEEPHDVILTFDGGYDKATGKAGLGAVIYYVQNNIHYRKRVNSLLDLIQDNNESEFAALNFAIQQLEEIGIRQQTVQIKGDSMQVIHQMNDEWPVTNEVFLYWIEKIEKKMTDSGIRATYELLPRNKNKQADKLASQALAGEQINALLEVDKDSI